MKKFENPELSVYNFSAEDIITTSTTIPGANVEGEQGEDETRLPF